MQLSHIIFKVDNLEAGVNQFRKEGFKVEYGSKTNPHNALIYFSEGPYIELLKDTPLPFYLGMLLRLIGKGKVVERLERWKNEKEGIVEICLENYSANFDKEEEILKRYNQKYFITKSKRLDLSDRLLKWKLLFADELRLPLMMTYFNIDPKPNNFVHPNGVKRIERVSFGTTEELLPILEDLCNDNTLTLYVGNGVTDLKYEY